MPSKNVLILAAVTAAVAAIAVAAAMSRQSATERVTVDALALPGLMDRVNDVDRIDLAGPEGEFALRFDGARWTVPALADFPADFDKVKKTLIALGELRLVEAKTSDPERYGRLGLAEPGAEDGAGTRLRLGAGDAETVAALTVGNPGRGGPDQVYIRRGDDAGTWLASGALDLGAAPKDWVDTLVVRLDGDRVRRVTISHAGDGERLEIFKTNPGEESFELAEMPEGATLRSPLTLDNLGRALAFVRFDEVAPAAEGPAAGAGDSTAVFETFDGVTLTVTLQARGEATWARFDAAYDPAAAEPEAAEDAPDETAAENEGAAETAEEAADETVDATALGEEEDPFDAEADTAQLLARTADWVFQLPDFKAEQLAMRLARLIDLPGSGEDEPEDGGPAVLLPDELPPGALPPGVEPPPVIQLD